MAWIESHQSLGRHPKLKTAARALGVSRPAMVGHLQYLWWWALDFAEDGDLSGIAAEDIAEEALWDGDPETFVTALVDSGFLTAELRLNDWEEYTGRLRGGREAYKEANRVRQQRYRERHRNDTENTAEEPRNVTVTLDNGPTIQNHTVPNHTEPVGVPPTPPVRARGPAETPKVVASRTGDAVDEQQPFALLEALCDVLGQDVSVLSRSEKARQLAVAKRLAESGMTARDVEMMTLWLTSQAWVTGGIERQVPKWKLAGKPRTAPVTQLTGKKNGEAATPDEWAEWRRKRGITGPDPPYPDSDVIDSTARTR
jgi:hypothetical protein